MPLQSGKIGKRTVGEARHMNWRQGRGVTLTEIRQLDDSLANLIPRAQRGDPEAFDELVRRCYHQIYRWALSHAGDQDEADDITQAVLIKLHRRLGSYRGGARFTTWLFRVTRNASLELQRRGSRHRHLGLDEVPLEAIQGDEPEQVDRSAATAAVRQAFQALPKGQRHVFDLVDLQGFTPKEVGEMLGMKSVTVRAHLSKARRAIRRRMLHQYPELVEELS